MNNPPQPPSGYSEMDSISIPMFNDDDDEPSSFTSIWEWNNLLEFDQFTTISTAAEAFPPVIDQPQPPITLPPPPELPIVEPDSSTSVSDKIRKRDPRLVCSNFLAGRVPCACPEMDAKLADEEEEEIGPGKKRARMVRVAPGGSRCQVQGCGADISELKGYHRRHRVCLRCANASTVVLDGEAKRYCQQCGKFHILSDFDEGKRSCRRKLERHNNRRRRKSSDYKGLTERESQQVLSSEDVGCDEEIAKVCLNNQEVERETFLEAERNIPTHCSAPGSQKVQSDSGVSLAASGETQCDEEKEKYTHSPSYCDYKSALSSVCPTGRISFKLYDWNPAEFPRRLRHQIFQWLASMPVELEGYIRPGCTILTVFIAMPNLMWGKLFDDPFKHIRHLVAPGNILSGRGTFYVSLNNNIFAVMKDGTSVVKVRVGNQAPKLHYVHPTCFEAGKPMEFVVCGSNLLQPNFRFLVSFAGKYLTDELSVSPIFSKIEENSSSSFDHQLLKICVRNTESDLFGPAFVEMENESGLSNFIPILIGDKEICSEMNIMQAKLDASLYSEESQSATSSSSCEVSVSRQKYFSDFVLDVAWLLKEPCLENKPQTPTSSQIRRFNSLLNFLIENQSLVVLERVACHVNIIMNNSLTADVVDAGMKQFKRNIDHANLIILQKFQNKANPALKVKNPVLSEDSLEQSSKIDMFPVDPVTNQDMLIEKSKIGILVASTSLDRSVTIPLLNTDVVMNVNHSKIEQSRKPSSRVVLTNTVLPSRLFIFLISAVAVCFGVCAVVLHPKKVGEIAVTIRRCLFDDY